MSDEDVRELIARVGKLLRDNRVLKITGAAVMAVLLAIALVGAGLRQGTVVFHGTPFVRVLTNMAEDRREPLTEDDKQQYQVLITKRNGDYFWSSREMTPVTHEIAGPYHWFISPTSGYVKILDTESPDAMAGFPEGHPRYFYRSEWGIGVHTGLE